MYRFWVWLMCLGVCVPRATAKTYEQDARRQLQRLALEAVRQERESAALRLREDGMRLGSLSVVRAGPIGVRTLPLAAPNPKETTQKPCGRPRGRHAPGLPDGGPRGAHRRARCLPLL